MANSEDTNYSQAAIGALVFHTVTGLIGISVYIVLNVDYGMLSYTQLCGYGLVYAACTFDIIAGISGIRALKKGAKSTYYDYAPATICLFIATFLNFFVYLGFVRGLTIGNMRSYLRSSVEANGDAAKEGCIEEEYRGFHSYSVLRLTEKAAYVYYCPYILLFTRIVVMCFFRCGILDNILLNAPVMTMTYAYADTQPLVIMPANYYVNGRIVPQRVYYNEQTGIYAFAPENSAGSTVLNKPIGMEDPPPPYSQVSTVNKPTDSTTATT